jgi:hypothetical protein
MAAFQAAIDAGHGIELDVRASRDSRAIVFHDAELDRLTDEQGEVAARTAAELGRIALKGGAGETIPDLPAVLALIAGRVPLLIEVKAPDTRVAALCLAVFRALDGYLGPVGVMSFNPEVARWFARHGPRVTRGLVVTEAGRRRRGRLKRRLALWRARPDFLAYDMPRSAVRLCRARANPRLADLHLDLPHFRRRSTRAPPCRPDHPRAEPLSDGELVARVGAGVSAIDAAAWDACAGSDNPFLTHAFLSALEESGSAVARMGWRPAPISIDGADGQPAAILPAYLKSHSQGEYVFDHAWADAYARAGGRYYPKLQIAVPFTPVPGRRLLLRDPALAPALVAAAEQVVHSNRLSGAHATFIDPAELPTFEDAGWLIRVDSQFHWHNEAYGSFDDFLGTLSSRKRKAIRKERAAALDGLTVEHVTGAAITERHWDAFWVFYQDTGARKWGQPLSDALLLQPARPAHGRPAAARLRPA